MREMWVIETIVHNGKKGERGTAVSDEKYNGLVGCWVSFDPEKIKIGYGLTMYIAPNHHQLYDWWAISCIQRVDECDNGAILKIETLNSIYYLKRLNEELNYD